MATIGLFMVEGIRVNFQDPVGCWNLEKNRRRTLRHCKIDFYDSKNYIFYLIRKYSNPKESLMKITIDQTTIWSKIYLLLTCRHLCWYQQLLRVAFRIFGVSTNSNECARGHTSIDNSRKLSPLHAMHKIRQGKYTVIDDSTSWQKI